MAFLDEHWPVVLAFMDAHGLCITSSLNVQFHQLSDCDCLWRAMCRSRWIGKQWMPDEIFGYGNYDHSSLSNDECRSILKRGGVWDDLMDMDFSLQQLVCDLAPRVVQCQFRTFGKWKASYVYAEVDAKRQSITGEEVKHFRWRSNSSFDLCHFLEDREFVRF